MYPPDAGVIGMPADNRTPPYSVSPGCGGYRHALKSYFYVVLCIPRMRGLSVLSGIGNATDQVYPPDAGVIGLLMHFHLSFLSVSPGCGGYRERKRANIDIYLYVPRARGLSVKKSPSPKGMMACPPSAGVIGHMKKLSWPPLRASPGCGGYRQTKPVNV